MSYALAYGINMDQFWRLPAHQQAIVKLWTAHVIGHEWEHAFEVEFTADEVVIRLFETDDDGRRYRIDGDEIVVTEHRSKTWPAWPFIADGDVGY